MVCFCSNIWLGLSLMSLFCPICHVFAVIQTGINGPRWPTHLGIGWKNSPLGALPFLALSKYIRPCIGRRVLCKPGPTRDVCDVMEAGQDYGGVFIVGTHCCSHGGGSSGQHVTLHPCDGWKLIQPPVWASAKGSRLTRTWCGPCGGFSGENLWCQKAEVKCCNLVYLETRGPPKPRGPSPTCHSWQISGSLLESVCSPCFRSRGFDGDCVCCCNRSLLEQNVPAVPRTDIFTSHTASQHLPFNTT